MLNTSNGFVLVTSFPVAHASLCFHGSLLKLGVPLGYLSANESHDHQDKAAAAEEDEVKEVQVDEVPMQVAIEHRFRWIGRIYETTKR